MGRTESPRPKKSEARPVHIDLVDAAAADNDVEQLFRLTFEHAPIGIAVVATDGRWLRVNRALCRITGYSESELLAGRFQDITHPDDLSLDLAHVDRLVTGELSEYELDKRYIRADDSQVWVRLHVSAATDSDGRVLHLIAHIEDITRRRQAEDDLVHAATHDQLTQAANRTLLLDRMAQALAASRRSHAVVGVLFCDLDGFKTLNDRLGHPVGDDILRLVAARIRLAIRPGDTLARIGGDEFVVLAPDLGSIEQVERIAARVRTAVAMPLPIADAAISLTISVGCAVGSGIEPDPEVLLAEADQAMYRAKSARHG